MIQQERQARGVGNPNTGGIAPPSTPGLDRLAAMQPGAQGGFEQTSLIAQRRSAASGAFGRGAQMREEARAAQEGNLQGRRALFAEMRGDGEGDITGRGEEFRERARNLGVDEEGWGHAMTRLEQLGMDISDTDEAPAEESRPTRRGLVGRVADGAATLANMGVTPGMLRSMIPPRSERTAPVDTETPDEGTEAAPTPIVRASAVDPLPDLVSDVETPAEGNGTQAPRTVTLGDSPLLTAFNAQATLAGPAGGLIQGARQSAGRALSGASVNQYGRALDFRNAATQASVRGTQISNAVAQGAIMPKAGVVVAERGVAATQAGNTAMRNAALLKRASDVVTPTVRNVAGVGDSLIPTARAAGGLRGLATGLGRVAPILTAGQGIYEAGALALDGERRQQREDEYGDLAEKGAVRRAWAGVENPVATLYGAGANLTEAGTTGSRARQSGRDAEATRAEMRKNFSNEVKELKAEDNLSPEKAARLARLENSLKFLDPPKATSGRGRGRGRNR